MAMDISFNCPKCDGPLICEEEYFLMELECPHCLKVISVPKGEVIDKDTWVEPMTLRRLLKEVRDREWEILRRDCQTAKAKLWRAEQENKALRQRFTDTNTALEKLRREGGRTDVTTLRHQVAQLGEQFVQANRTFMSGRQQQDKIITTLRTELADARQQADQVRKSHDQLERALDRMCVEADSLRTEVEVLRKNPPVQEKPESDLLQAVKDLEDQLATERDKVRLLESAVRATFKAVHTVNNKPAELSKEQKEAEALETREQKRSKTARLHTHLSARIMPEPSPLATPVLPANTETVTHDTSWIEASGIRS